MERKGLLSITCILFIGMLIACQKEAGTSSKQTELKTFAAAEISIERLRKKEVPDWEAIKEQYAHCAPLVEEIDNNHNTAYNKDILKAIDKCKNNIDARVNQQMLAKGLQHIAVMKIRDLLGSMSSAPPEERKQIAADIAVVFEGIRPTFVRRDADYYGGRKTLEKEADMAIQALEASAGGNSLAAASRLERVINKTYALCVLYEMQSIETLRETSHANCDVKRAEAVIFYRIIEQRIKKTDRIAHQTIKAVLNADYTAINSAQLKKALNRGLSLKINS